MELKGIDVVSAAKLVVKKALHDDVAGLAAELAYRILLAIFPFFIFLAALSSFVAGVLGVDDPAFEVVGAFGGVLPPRASELIQGELEQVVEEQNPGLLSLGALGALFFATGGVNSVIKAVNRAYSVPETRPFWKRYLLALGLTVLTGLLVIVAFVLFFLGQVFGGALAESLGLGAPFWTAAYYLRWPVAFVLLLAAVGFLYWKVPNIDLPFKWITPGAVLFSLGWLLSTYVFGLYVANFGEYATTYGTLAGAVVMLLWLYTISIVLLLGAEVNDVVDEMVDPRGIEERRRGKKAETTRED